MEQATTRSRRRTVSQHAHELAGQTLERYGRFQLTGFQPINLKYKYNDFFFNMFCQTSTARIVLSHRDSRRKSSHSLGQFIFGIVLACLIV